MGYKRLNRVKMTTSTVGTGTVTLGSAVSTFQTVDAAGGANGDALKSLYEDGTAWEVSKGIYTTSGTTLTRVLIASSTGSLISLSGSATMAVLETADDFSNFDEVILPQGRLTLQSGAPIQTAEQTAKTTVYYAAYTGIRVPVYDGYGWQYLTITSNEISMGLSTSHVSSGSLYDIWAVNNSGSLVIGVGPAWSSATSRGTGAGTTEWEYKDGIRTNKNSLTNVWGGASGTTDYGSVSANQATLLGTLYATGNGQTGMAIFPAAASGGANNILGLSNAYNRVKVNAVNQDSKGSWTYNSTTYRPADGASSNTNFRISFIDSIQQSEILGSYNIHCTRTSNGPVTGMNLDSTTAVPVSGAQTNASGTQMCALDRWYPQLGFHYIQAMEACDGNNTATFFGLIASPTRQLNSLIVTLDM